MRVTKTTSRTEKTYKLSIEGGEVRPQRYSSAERKYRVDKVTVIKRDGNVSSVMLAGPVLKKDGTDSLNAHEERLYGDYPAWVTSLLKGLA